MPRPYLTVPAALTVSAPDIAIGREKPGRIRVRLDPPTFVGDPDVPSDERALFEIPLDRDDAELADLVRGLARFVADHETKRAEEISEGIAGTMRPPADPPVAS